MGERSFFVNVMLVLIALILLVGFYFTVKAVDIYRLREERLVAAMQTIDDDLGRLRGAIEGGGLTATPKAAATGSAPAVIDTNAAASAHPAPAKAEAAPPFAAFANMDLRDPKAVEGDTLVSSTLAETRNMNAIVNNDAEVASFWDMTYDSLAARNMKNPDHWEPQLATSWELDTDGLTYTIHLRRGPLWHDFTDPETQQRYTNVPVTAADFKFYVDVIKNPGINCEPQRVYLKDLDRVEILDDFDFKVIWKQRYFMSQAITLGLAPLPRHFYRFDPAKPDQFNNNFDRNRMIVGCGPWVFDRWDKGNEIVFVRNEKYYGPKPYLRKRRVRIIKDENAQFTALTNGELDMLGLQPNQWVNQSNTPDFLARFNKLQYPALGYSYIGYNMRRPPFDDRRVRLAMTHLVNRERILREVDQGLGRVVTGTFFIDGPYYDRSIQPWPFDLDKARELLAEAGWRDTNGDNILDKDGKDFEVTFMIVQGMDTQTRTAAIIKEDAERVGIKVSIDPLEWSVYTQRLEEWNFDMCSLGWQLDYEEDPYQLWHSSQADLRKSSNHVGFKNAEADRIIEAARREFDLQKRIKLYFRLDEILHQEQPYTWLICPDALVAVDKRFQNVIPYKLGLYRNAFWVPRDQQKYKE